MLLPAAMAATLSTSRPAQKAEPSPESTTARKLRSSLSLAPASAIARNIAGSRAFILSARLSRTSAMPSAIVSRMRSSDHLLSFVTQNAASVAARRHLGRVERSKTKRGAHVEPGEWAAQAKRAEELANRARRPASQDHAALRSPGVKHQMPPASRASTVGRNPNGSGVTPRIHNSMRSTLT